MFRSTQSRRLLSATAVLAIAFLVGCSGDKSTNPPPSGGGAKELDSAQLAHSGVYAHTFMTAGTFPYHCKVHNVMTAMVTVTVGGPAAAAVGITDNAFGAANTSIGTGGTVTWTNNGSNPHTVTSD